MLLPWGVGNFTRKKLYKIGSFFVTSCLVKLTYLSLHMVYGVIPYYVSLSVVCHIPFCRDSHSRFVSLIAFFYVDFNSILIRELLSLFVAPCFPFLT